MRQPKGHRQKFIKNSLFTARYNTQLTLYNSTANNNHPHNGWFLVSDTSYPQQAEAHKERLCHRKRLMPFSMAFQGNNQQNASAMKPAKEKTGEKAVFSPYCRDETTTYYDRA